MRISLRSIAISWMLALCLLGLISLNNQTFNDSTPETQVQLPLHLVPSGPDSLQKLQITTWCALESHQTVAFSLQDRTIRFRGAMAIAPHWQGKQLPEPEQQLVDNCVANRLHQLTTSLNDPEAPRAALSFLFTRL